MVQHESRQTPPPVKVNGKTIQIDRSYNQFNSYGSTASVPNFGSPDGWGIAQLDKPLGQTASTSEVYSWCNNVAKFYLELLQKRAFSTSYVNALRVIYSPLNKWEEPPESFTHPRTQELTSSMTSLEAAWVTLYNGASWLVEIKDGNIVYDGSYTDNSMGGKRYVSTWKFNPAGESGHKWEYIPNRNDYLYKVIHDEWEGMTAIQE
jgi:hypothetical protein